MCDVGPFRYAPISLSHITLQRLEQHQNEIRKGMPINIEEYHGQGFNPDVKPAA